MALHHPWVFVFGLLGNIISFVVYLAPVPTFIRVYKKKSTEGFQSIPYVCAIFSSMLWIYYAMVKTNAMLLITINSFGCVVETIYIAIYLKYADKEAKMSTIKMVVGLNLVGFSAILLVCHYLPTPALRVQVLGWICVGFATVVFAAPLSIMRLVIRTKSVEFMPFPLSLSLTISAVMWFMYGLLMKDMYIVFPNILGFTFGIAQMILYGIYRNRKLPAAPIHVEEIKPTEDIEMKLPAAPQQNDVTNCNDMIMKLDDINASSVRNAVASATVVHHEYRREDDKDDDDVTKTAEYHGDHDQLVHRPSQCRTAATDDHGIQIVPSTGGTTTTTVHLVDCAV